MTSVIDYSSCESDYEDHCWKPVLYWNEPCPVCTTKNGLEVKEQLSPNIRPPAALGVGEHTINYTFTYNLSSGSLRETKCSAKIRVYAGILYLNLMEYNTIQYNTIQYNTIQYNTIQYNTIQYNTIQYKLYFTRENVLTIKVI